MQQLINRIKFGDALINNPNIFSDTAKKAAETINEKTSDTQMRRFYNEVLVFHTKLSQSKEKEAEFKKLMPFIYMIKAKVAYAKGRGKVCDNYSSLLNHCIDQSKDLNSFEHCKLFLEAVLAYSKKKK